MAPQTSPVLILGAGATKACDGPLTNEILWEVGQQALNLGRKDAVDKVFACLKEVFRLPDQRTPMSYPSLPLLMSLIDTAIDRAQPLGRNHDVEKLREVRRAMEYAIFAILEYKLRGQTLPYHRQAIERIFPPPAEPRIISLNYDIIADNTLADYSQTRGTAFPDYGCEIQTDVYKSRSKFGKLYKLHGSLNWLYCPNCHRLDVAVSHSGRTFSKALQELFGATGDLAQGYSEPGWPCPTCVSTTKTTMRPVMITPTQKKDYRNPHIAQVWYKAEEMLRSADSAIFIGYSMPSDDVEVVYLLKRGLASLGPEKITVVACDEKNRSADEHEVGQRYQSIFGRGIQWHTCGFEGWLQEDVNKVGKCRGVPAKQKKKSRPTLGRARARRPRRRSHSSKRRR